jgi:hypothetical protein
LLRDEFVETAVPNWFQKGTVLGVAVDLGLGTMMAAVDGSQWTTVFSSGLCPGLAVGSELFPALSGMKGATIRYNLGQDLVHRPLKIPPPTAEFIPLAMASKISTKVLQLQLAVFSYSFPPLCLSQVRKNSFHRAIMDHLQFFDVCLMWMNVRILHQWRKGLMTLLFMFRVRI